MRLAWPLTLREQGPLVRAGIDAVTLTARGELPRPPGADTLAGVSADRLTRFGRAAFRGRARVRLAALPAASRAARDLVVGRNVLPGWSLALLAVGAHAAGAGRSASTPWPARAAAGSPVGEWVRWALGAALAVRGRRALGAVAFELVDWLPEIDRGSGGAGHRTVASARRRPLLAALALLLALAWITVRRLFAARRRTCADPVGRRPRRSP